MHMSFDMSVLPYKVVLGSSVNPNIHFLMKFCSNWQVWNDFVNSDIELTKAFSICQRLLPNLEWMSKTPILWNYKNCDAADPDRNGLSPLVIRWLLESRARTIVYVSCDVATQVCSYIYFQIMFPHFSLTLLYWRCVCHFVKVILLKRS